MQMKISHNSAITKLQASIIILIVIIAAVGGYFAYLATLHPPTAMEVKIGLLYPRTGSAAAYAKEVEEAYNLFIGKINEGGGIKSLGGSKIRLIWADTESSSDVGVTAIEKLITLDNVHLIMGCIQSSVALATIPVAEKYQIPYYCVEPAADEITELGYKWVVRHRTHPSIFGRDMFGRGGFIEYLEKIWGTKIATFVHFFEDASIGWSTEKGLKAFHDLYRPDINYISLPHPASPSTLDIEIAKLKDIDPDIVLMNNFPPAGMLAIDTMVRLGYNPKFLLTVTCGVSEEFIEHCGKKLLGFVTVDSWSSGCTYPNATFLGKTLDEWEETFIETYGHPITCIQIEILGAVSTVYEVLEMVGSVEPEAIRQGFHTIKNKHHFHPYETIEFDDSGQNPNARYNPGLYVWDKKLNRVRYISCWPPEFSPSGIEKYLIFPAPSWEEREKMGFVWPPEE